MRILLLLVFIVSIGISSCRKDGKYWMNNYHRQKVGKWSHQILSKKTYTALTIQVIYMTGYRPTDEAIANLTTLLTERCNKPKGINVVYKEISAQGKSSYSLSDIRQIEDDNRTEFTRRKTIAITCVFVDGASSYNSGSEVIFGDAYYNTSLVIFEKTVHDYSDEYTFEPERYKLETVAINHAMGHILGLVNSGSSMMTIHYDTSHYRHCDNTDCLMYWEEETGSAVDKLLGNSPIPTLDANCIADLKRNSGKYK